MRRRKFAPPTIPGRRSRSRNVRTEIIRPTGGLNLADPPWNLRPEESPDMQNYVLSQDGTHLVQRSGLSKIGSLEDHAINEAVGAALGITSDSNASDVQMAVSDLTAIYRYEGLSWASIALTDPPASHDTNFYDHAVVRTSSNLSELHVFTNGFNLPHFLSLEESGPLTDTIDLSNDSRAHYAEGYDERLMVFNTSSVDSEDRRTRVMWSVKGAPTDFSSIGAGLQDLADMRGEGTGIWAQKDRLILASTEEIWGGRARNDSFAFDFFPIERAVGIDLPRTAVLTDGGLIWLNKDLRFRRLIGSEVRTFGGKVRRYLQERRYEPTFEEKVYAVYDEARKAYQLWFVTGTAGADVAATRALELRVDTLQPVSDLGDIGVWTAQNLIGSQFQFFNGHETFFVNNSAESNAVFVFDEDSVEDEDRNGISASISPYYTTRFFRSEDPSMYEAISEVWADMKVESTVTTTNFDVPLWIVDNPDVENLGGSSNALSTTSFTLDVTDSSTPSEFSTQHAPITPVASQHQGAVVRSGAKTGGTRMTLSSIRLTLRQYTGRFSG